MLILNLTQHQATAEQVAAGVIEPNQKTLVQELLTFATPPSKADIQTKADALTSVAMHSDCKAAMIGGAPYLMPALEAALKEVGIQPLYSFTQRESVDQHLDNGSVRKVAIFRHAGWIEV